MNEQNELLNKDILEPSINPEVDPNQAMYDMIHESKINRILLVTYLLVTIAVSLFTMAYQNLRFSNSDIILGQIVYDVSPDMTVTDDPTDTEYPYLVSISSTIHNQNTITIPSLFIKFTFYDEFGTNIGDYTASQEKVLGGEYWVMSELLNSDTMPASFTTEMGIDFTSLYYLFINFLSVFVAGSLFLFIDKTNFKKDWVTFKKAILNNIAYIVLGYIFVNIALYASQYIFGLLGIEGTSANESTIASMFSTNPINLVLLFLLLCIFTPIVEEIIFRKVVYNFFQPRLGNIVAILGSGLIFGLMHVVAFSDYIQSIPYILMGFVFGFIYYVSKKNIFVTIGLHFVNNFVSFATYVALMYGLISG
ncbi:MAG: CPBP family glutamic-type intramembrane protease [Candidatus Izemoplasmatales bacterium]|jgi:hypothetical protein|nr:CPBP family glutamic-type intramembrane protease [Candidatus Izemoplasmatales bacterium]